MDNDDPFSRELRSARDRIAELQRRSRATPRPGGGLLPEAPAELDVAIEELSVTGEELRSQNRRAGQRPRGPGGRAPPRPGAVRVGPVAYLVTDPLARIREANRAAAALLGVEQRFLAGKPLAASVAGGDRWGFRSLVNRLNRGEDERVRERPLRLRRRGGEVVMVAVTVEPVRRPSAQLAALRWLLRRLARGSG